MRFTQFLFPDGRRKENHIPMPVEIERLADELVAAGYSFEIECFPDTQLIHADCCDEEEAIETELCPNGPEVPVMVERLVRSAHANWTTLGKKLSPNPRKTPQYRTDLLYDGGVGEFEEHK